MIAAIIPAKGQSERVPGKNMRPLGGRPLVAWTIEAALGSRVERVYVSTDDPAIAALAREMGAEVIDRPAALSAPGVEVAEVVAHALTVVPASTLVVLLPTSPFRSAQDVDAALDLHQQTGQSVASAVLRWSFTAQAPGVIKRPAPNGAIWVMSRVVFEDLGHLHCEIPYLMSEAAGQDIDHAHEFAAAEWLAGGTRYAFDLDGTLCRTRGMDYGAAMPIPERVALVNELHSRGNHITIDTARAPEHAAMTRAQLQGWGVQFDELRVGQKVAADVYVDDRAVHAGDFR